MKGRLLYRGFAGSPLKKVMLFPVMLSRFSSPLSKPWRLRQLLSCVSSRVEKPQTPVVKKNMMQAPVYRIKGIQYPVSPVWESVRWEG